MGQYPARMASVKNSFSYSLLWQERGGNGHRRFIAGNLVAKAPIGTPCIEWIKDEIAALRRVELRRELQRRIVDDGGLFPFRQSGEESAGSRRTCRCRYRPSKVCDSLRDFGGYETLGFAHPGKQFAEMI